MKRKWLVWTIPLVLLVVMPSFAGQIYQYTDENGVVSFTDDSSLIPEDQREDAQTIESIQSDYQNDYIPETQVETRLGIDHTPAGKVKEKARELDAIGKELVEEFNALQAEKAALGDPPSNTTRTRDRNEYNKKIEELNKKIDHYNERKKEYEEKIEAFNSQLRSK